MANQTDLTKQTSAKKSVPVQYYFLVHVLVTCALSLILLEQFWQGQTILNLDTGVGYEEQLGFSLLGAVIAVYIVTYLIKRRRGFIKFKAWMLHVLISVLYFLAAFTFLGGLVDWIPAAAASFFFALGFFFSAENHSRSLPIFTMIISILIVFPIGLFLPLTYVALSAAAYSLYDLYSVYRGPLGKLINGLKDQNKLDLLKYSGLATPIQGRILGLGDSVFYSVLFASVWLNVNWIAGLACLSGISIGFLLTFSLAKTKPMPALPLSIGLGLLFSFFAWVI